MLKIWLFALYSVYRLHKIWNSTSIFKEINFSRFIRVTVWNYIDLKYNAKYDPYQVIILRKVLITAMEVLMS